MKQTYHSNSTTNIRLRAEISKSNLPYRLLSSRYGVSKNTIGKQNNRVDLINKSSRSHTIKYTLSKITIL